MQQPFEPGPSTWTGPPLTPELVRRAERTLGVRLPRGYLDLLYRQNGGILTNGCCPTDFRTSWAPDHFQVDVLLGIGYDQGIDATSSDLIAEWDYPDVGPVLGITPSGGHDTVMLDYTASGPDGEPAVVYVGEDRTPRRVADSFDEFLARLVPCEAYEEADEDEDGSGDCLVTETET